ncbi:MAG: TlpA family protein disulfide reductase [Gammaproteobacteria bacterium]
MRYGSSLLSVAAISVMLIVFGEPQAATARLEGAAAPDFTLKSSNGYNMRLSEYRGQVVMINFWATWCGPCRQEIPVLNELHFNYKPLGFVMLGVNLDEKPGKALHMAQEMGMAYPVLFDQQKDVSRLYEIDAMPTTVLIDRDGTVRHVHRGYKVSYGETYQQQIRKLIKE